jgi:hypothetical protein
MKKFITSNQTCTFHCRNVPNATLHVRHANTKELKDVLHVKHRGLSVLIFMPVYLVVGQENSLLAHVVTVINLKVSILVYEYR